MEKPAKNMICLWYDGTAEDAARFFYAETFPDSSVDAVHHAPGACVDRRIYRDGNSLPWPQRRTRIQTQRSVLVSGRNR
jgi:hypothetical protein